MPTTEAIIKVNYLSCITEKNLFEDEAFNSVIRKLLQPFVPRLNFDKMPKRHFKISEAGVVVQASNAKLASTKKFTDIADAAVPAVVAAAAIPAVVVAAAAAVAIHGQIISLSLTLTVNFVPPDTLVNT